RMMDTFKDPQGLIPQAKQTLLANAVMKACDANDGVTDNLITNPQACKFDPAVLQCKAEDAADCLTTKQVATARRLYTDAKNSKGELIFPGYAYGGELAYNIMRGSPAPGADVAANPVPGDLQLGTFRYLAHQDANWDWKTFNLDADTALAKKMGGIIDAVETDMSKFKNRGGKLLMFHGWADPAIPSEHTIVYYNDVLKKMGKD